MSRLARSVALLLFSALPLAAEDLALISDVNTTPRALAIQTRCALGEKEILFADDGIRGTEVWIGDGLAGSTHLLKDINPGFASSVSSQSCTVVGDAVFFPANDGSTGYELWKTDGTAEGTVQVKDIVPGTGSSEPDSITALGSIAVFAANDTATGRELWRTDGTESGTFLVKDIEPGAGSATPRSFAVLGGSALIFAAETSAAGSEVWRTDGSTAGTYLLKDIETGATGSIPYDFTSLGTKVFFAATTSSEGTEPWITDGTGPGTLMLGDFDAGAQSGYYPAFGGLAILDGKLLFTGRDASHGWEPWVTDGTAAGTQMLKDVNVGAGDSQPTDARVVAGKFAFSAYNTATGRELWTSDGSTAGTTLLTDLSPGGTMGVYSFYGNTLSNDSLLVFLGQAHPGRGFTEIYSTDTSSVTLLADVFPGTRDFDAAVSRTSTSAGITFGLASPVNSIPPATRMLTRGTPDSTTTHPGTLAGYTESSAAIPLGVIGGKLLFAADDGTHGYELWTTDGTSSGTIRLTDINPGIASSIIPSAGFAVLGNQLFFVATTAVTGAELWRSDGTEAGTQLVADIEPGAGSAFSASPLYSRKFFKVGDSIIFVTQTTAYGAEPWVYSGTTGTVQILRDTRPGPDSGVADFFEGAVVASGGTDYLYFAANDGADGTELWLSDGSSAAGHTVFWADIEPGAGSSSPRHFVPYPAGGGVIFTACDSAAGCEPWLSTGFVTARIKDVYPGATGSLPDNFTFLPQPPYTLFFSAVTAEGTELWKSDLTEPGTVLVKDAVPGADGVLPTDLMALNGTTLLFRGCGTPVGLNCELWKSDGTAGGTGVVKDIVPGESSTSPDMIGVLSGVGYFLGRDPQIPASTTVYRTDGTAAGTYPLTEQGLEPYSLSNLPERFISAFSTIVFGAYSSVYGFELFKVGTDECPGDDTKSVPGACGCGVTDSDADGDGAVDCQEACPADPLKQTTGACGCGVSYADANGNGAADCLERALQAETPPAPRLRKRGRKIRVTMTERAGVQYEVLYRIQRTGASLRPTAAFKSKMSNTTSTDLKAPRPGRTLYVKYRYVLPGTSATSRTSAVKRKRVR